MCFRTSNVVPELIGGAGRARPFLGLIDSLAGDHRWDSPGSEYGCRQDDGLKSALSDFITNNSMTAIHRRFENGHVILFLSFVISDGRE